MANTFVFTEPFVRLGVERNADGVEITLSGPQHDACKVQFGADSKAEADALYANFVRMIALVNRNIKRSGLTETED